MRAPRVTPVLAALATTWALGLAVPDLHLAVLFLAPAVLLALIVALGRYPGQRLLLRLAPPPRPRRRRATSTVGRPLQAPRLSHPPLLASCRAGRAPPAAAA